MDIWGKMPKRQGHSCRCQGQQESVCGGAEWRVRKWWLTAEGSGGREGEQILMGLGGQWENLASLWEIGNYFRVLGRMVT